MKTQTKKEMNIENIPTPETDARWDDCEDSCGNPMVAVDVGFARDLERRLTVARDALKFAFDAVTSVTVKSRAEGEILQSAARVAKEALTTTTPKL